MEISINSNYLLRVLNKVKFNYKKNIITIKS